MSGTIVAMFIMNWKLAILIGALLVAKSLHTVKFNTKMKYAFRANRVKAGELSAVTEESLSGIRLVKAFAMEDFEHKKFVKKVRNYVIKISILQISGLFFRKHQFFY